MANFEKAFSLRPEIYAAWVALNGSIKTTMDLRRYELATLAAAGRLRSTYRCLAHALGVQADAKLSQMEPGLREALTVGRPIENG